MLASSGKLDKKALPSVNISDNDMVTEGKPSTETEVKLSPLWADVLNVKVIDVQESFFDMGG